MKQGANFRSLGHQKESKTMKCSVHIATSLDGYIATKDNGLDWLHSAGKPEVEVDAGWQSYVESVDCMIMGRSTMQVISSAVTTLK